MLGHLLTKIYTLFAIIFGKYTIPAIEDMEKDNEPPIELPEYQQRLLFLQDTLNNLPESITEAGDFDPLNYKLIVSKFSDVSKLIKNLELIRNKFIVINRDPANATTDLPDFIFVTNSSDQSWILAKFLEGDGKYLNLKEVVGLLKKHTGEVILLYTQMIEQAEIDEDLVHYFERITIPSIREIIHFVEKLHILGVKNV